MTTALRRWSGWTIAAAMVASAGCGQPPPMVPMTPVGVGGDPLAPNLEDDMYKAQALGETTAAQQRAKGSGEAAQDADLPQTPREPTEPGEEVELENGLRYQTLDPGDPDGKVARVGDRVSVFYKGTLENGSQFDSNLGKEPIEFNLETGPGGLIRGWVEGIPGMKVGERRLLTIPPDLGYGAQGMGALIPPNSVLIFEVELVDVK